MDLTRPSEPDQPDASSSIVESFLYPEPAGLHTPALRPEDTAFLHAAVRATHDAVIGLTIDGLITHWNPEAESLFQHSAEEAIRSSYAILDCPDAGFQTDNLLTYLRTYVASFTGNTVRRRRDGRHVFVDLRVTPILDGDGGISSFIALARETGRLQRAMHQLHESEQRYQSLVEAKHKGVWMVDSGNRITMVNRRTEEILGYTEEELLGTELTSYIISDSPPLLSIAPDHLPHGVMEDIEARLARKDGGTAWVLLSIYRLWSDDGSYAGAEGLITDITDRKRDEEALAAAYRRERLLNTIGQTTRAAVNREQVQQVAVSELGAALEVDRCYLLTFDFPHDLLTVQAEYRRASLAALPSPIAISALDVDVEGQFHDGNTLAMIDTQLPEPRSAWSPSMAGIFARAGVRSVIAVPLHQSPGVMSVLCVAMAAGFRRWTQHDIALVEAVAAHTRSSSEAAVALERERTVALQLQQALLPEIPESVPGLKIGSYIRVAEQEMGVGGDFFDVFSIQGKGTLLVVGDMTGKGLPAAAQVSTVRNMLRYAVVRGRTLAGALANLNEVLVDQELLTGFATLFVGAYDHLTRTLEYVNCGQEPALVCRADGGAVEELSPTGNVLGGFREAAYRENRVVLESGDVLAIFTDGLTEVGISRAAMLGMQGAANLLAQKATATLGEDPAVRASALPEEIAAGLLEFSGGHVNDDICLLVGVVE